MQTKQIIALIIYILLPLAGLLVFLKIRKNIIASKITSPPIPDIFILFINYGGLLMVLYTVLFWEWSGAASLGVFYLVFGAPIASVVVIYRQLEKQTISKYHEWSYHLSLSYFGIATLVMVVLYNLDVN